MNTIIGRRKQQLEARLQVLQQAEQAQQSLDRRAHAEIWAMIQKRLGLDCVDFDDDFALQVARRNEVICYAVYDDFLTLQELHDNDMIGLPVVLYTWNPCFYQGKVDVDVEVRQIQGLFH